MFSRANTKYSNKESGFFSSNPSKAGAAKSTGQLTAKNNARISWDSKGFEHPKTDSDSESDSGFNKENIQPTKNNGSLKRVNSSEVETRIQKTKAAKFVSEPQPQHSTTPAWATEYDNAVYQERWRQVSNRMHLSDVQLQVKNAVLAGHNVFFTGAAGTGKSVVLRETIRSLRALHGEDAVKVCATTGMAAYNIGGSTLHRWAGIGLGNDSADSLIKRIMKSQEKRKNWASTRVLIVDEVSMLDKTLFDKLCEIGNHVRRAQQKVSKISNTFTPFGGIQLVFAGDFFQLPPVIPDNKKADEHFCFNSRYWDELFPKHKQFMLNKVFRQEGDDQLIAMLNALRTGNITPDLTAKFQELSRPIQWKGGIEPSRLYPLKKEVAMANARRLNSLQGWSKKFVAVDVATPAAGIDPNNAAAVKSLLDANMLAVHELELKQNALVMYIKNEAEGGLVNGMKGIVTGFAHEGTWAKVCELDRQHDGFKDLYFSMFSTEQLGGDVKELSAKFTNKELRIEFIKLRATVLKYQGSLVPVVLFANGKEQLVSPQQFDILSVDGKRTLAFRNQLPLIHSWAISIHKSQGQTLEGVVVDLSSAFENGQAYVALSRATSTSSLQVLNFKESKVMVSDEVRKFYDTLTKT